MARPREMLRAFVRLATSAASGCARAPVPVAGVSPRVLVRFHAPTSTFGIGAPLGVASTASFARGVVSSYRAPRRVFGSARDYAHAAGGRATDGDDETERNAPAGLRVNQQITARQVRLVSDPGDGGGEAGGEKKSHEVISTIVAIRRAKQAGLDLVEVNPRANPPVCRLMNYDAFRYELRQKERDARKRAVERRRHDQVKELRLSARISANDLKTKADQTERFLEQGHKVTMRIEFKSNDGVKQKLRPKAGAILYDEFRALLGPHRVEVEGKMVGPNHMIMQVAPVREKKGKTSPGKSDARERDGEGGKRRGKRDEDERDEDERDARASRDGSRGDAEAANAANAANANANASANASRAADEALSRAAEGNGGVYDAAAAEAAVAAQAATVRRLKARRAAGDADATADAVDAEVATLLELKSRAEKARRDREEDEKPKPPETEAETETETSEAEEAEVKAEEAEVKAEEAEVKAEAKVKTSAFFSAAGTAPRESSVTTSPTSSPEPSPSPSRVVSSSSSSSTLARRVATAKAEAAAAATRRREAAEATRERESRRANIEAIAARVKTAARRAATPIPALDTEPATRDELEPSEDRERARAAPAAAFALGAEAEAHLARERERIRRLRADHFDDRVEGTVGDGARGGGGGGEAGAWGPAAAATAATTLAAAFGAYLLAVDGPERRPEPAVELATVRIPPGEDTNRRGEASAGGVAGDAVASFAAGAAVVVSALGRPPPGGYAA